MVKGSRNKSVCYLSVWRNFIKSSRSHAIKIRFSKFCELHPKWCIPVGSASGANSVFVCQIHQNAKLIANFIPAIKDYEELLETMVCNISNRDCRLHSCDQCPGTVALKEKLESIFGEYEKEHINFKQWKKDENKTDLLSCELSI